MMHLKADDLPLSILSGVHDEVVLYDETGTRVIGHFTPVNLEQKKRVYAEAIARTDHEELARRAAEPGPRRSHKEILQELAALYPVDSSNGCPPMDSSISPGSKECAAQ